MTSDAAGMIQFPGMSLSHPHECSHLASCSIQLAARVLECSCVRYNWHRVNYCSRGQKVICVFWKVICNSYKEKLLTFVFAKN